VTDDRQPWRRLSPQIDRLQDAADTQEATLADQVVVAHAENTVSSTRRDDLMQIQAKTWRRVSAARGILTRAQKAGDPERIRRALQRLDERQSEAEAISEACITEMQNGTRLALDRLSEILKQHAASDAASRRVTDAIAAHRPQQHQ
jgi:hypothetical protein